VTRILLVEDEPVVRRLFTTILSADGFEVRSTGSLLETKTVLSTESFDLVISDYSLPDGNADSLYDWIKTNHPELTNLFILTTGWAGKKGFPFILEKPFHIKDLESLIMRVLKSPL